MARASIVIAVLAACLVAHTNAFPTLWSKSHCGTVPTSALGPHQAPTKDLSVKFSAKGGNKTVTALCPGAQYVITAAWTPGQMHRALLTTSVGSWADAPKTCKKSTTTTSASDSVAKKLTIPCSATGKATVTVVHSAPGSPFMTSSNAFTINTACKLAKCTKKTG